MAREALDLTQTQAADKSGISKSGWANYEAGDRLVDPHVAVRFCQAFGVTMDWIYLGRAAGLPRELFANVLSRSPHVPSRRH